MLTSLLFAAEAWYRLQSNLLGAPWSFELSEQSPGSDALGEDCWVQPLQIMKKSPFLMGTSPFWMGKSTINGPFSIVFDMDVSENVVYPIVPNGFADHYPYKKWLFHWEYTQHFQTNPNHEKLDIQILVRFPHKGECSGMIPVITRLDITSSSVIIMMDQNPNP